MQQLVTITSKRQFTIPATIYRQLGFQDGQKVLVSIDHNSMKVESAADLVNRLAGSVELPSRYRGMTMDTIIQKSKKDYFSGKNYHS